MIGTSSQVQSMNQSQIWTPCWSCTCYNIPSSSCQESQSSSSIASSLAAVIKVEIYLQSMKWEIENIEGTSLVLTLLTMKMRSLLDLRVEAESGKILIVKELYVLLESKWEMREVLCNQVWDNPSRKVQRKASPIHLSICLQVSLQRTLSAQFVLCLSVLVRRLLIFHAGILISSIRNALRNTWKQAQKTWHVWSAENHSRRRMLLTKFCRIRYQRQIHLIWVKIRKLVIMLMLRRKLQWMPIMHRIQMLRKLLMMNRISKDYHLQSIIKVELNWFSLKILL